jgi:hypothetical protein
MLLFGEIVPSTTLLSMSFMFTAIDPIAATTAAAGYIMKFGELFGPTLSLRSFDLL